MCHLYSFILTCSDLKHTERTEILTEVIFATYLIIQTTSHLKIFAHLKDSSYCMAPDVSTLFTQCVLTLHCTCGLARRQAGCWLHQTLPRRFNASAGELSHSTAPVAPRKPQGQGHLYTNTVLFDYRAVCVIILHTYIQLDSLDFCSAPTFTLMSLFLFMCNENDYSYKTTSIYWLKVKYLCNFTICSAFILTPTWCCTDSKGSACAALPEGQRFQPRQGQGVPLPVANLEEATPGRFPARHMGAAATAAGVLHRRLAPPWQR